MKFIFFILIILINGCSNKYAGIGSGYLIHEDEEATYLISIKNHKSPSLSPSLENVLVKMFSVENKEIRLDVFRQEQSLNEDFLKVEERLQRGMLPDVKYFPSNKKIVVEIVVTNSDNYFFKEKINKNNPVFRFYVNNQACNGSKSNVSCLFKILRAVYHELSHYYNDDKLISLIQQETYASSIELCANFSSKNFDSYTFSESVVKGYDKYEKYDLGTVAKKLDYWEVSMLGQYLAEKSFYMALGKNRLVRKIDYENQINHYCSVFYTSQ